MKSTPKAPKAPDPTQVANAQGQLNRDTATYNAALNRYNTYTPWGSSEFTVTGTDPETGAPIYSQSMSLSPEMQAMYGNVLGNLGPYDMSGLPGMPEDYSALRGQQSDALYGMATGYLDPQFAQQEDQMRTRLANQGVVEGSEAYNNAMDEFNRSKEFAYGQARQQAIAGGGEEASRAYGIDANRRQQALAEMLTGRSTPLNEFIALQTMNQVPGGYASTMAPADITNPTYQSYQGQVGKYNADVASQNQFMSGLFGLGGAGILALSDENAKENIHEIGELNDGTNLYLFNYKGDSMPHVGVMAQEVEKKRPDAVVQGADGYKRVNYSKVLVDALEAS